MPLAMLPALAFAQNWETAAILVIAERTGKALGGPARDVLLSGATQEVGHGWGFGLHSIMDQTGAVIGPLVMVAAVTKAHRFGPAFVWLAFPAVGTLILLLMARWLNPGRGLTASTVPTSKELPRAFWGYGGELATALLFGKTYDRFGLNILVVGIFISVMALPLGFLGGPAGAITSVVCWATGLGAQDACLRSGISSVVSMNKRGRAFGTFNGVYGVAWLLGSLAMGLLYSRSLPALVVFGTAAQMGAAVTFFRLRTDLPRSDF